MLSIRLLLLFSFFIGALSYGTEQIPAAFKWQGNLYKIIHKHKKKFRDFSKKTCLPGDEKKYWELLKDYRGTGYYLPKIGEDIDRIAIKENLPHMAKKIQYIGRILKQLKAQKSFPNDKKIHLAIEENLKELLLLKKKHHKSQLKKEKRKLTQASRKLMVKLRRDFSKYLDDIFFLKSYAFPNDFLDYRFRFERVKDLKGSENRKKSNKIFFYRKIVEDGAYDPDNSRPDRSVRSALDTVFLNLKMETDFISENVRFDLEWIQKKVKYLLKRGKKIQISRLSAWKQRSIDALDFYREIIKLTNKKKAVFLVKKENESSRRLKNFIYKKQADVYTYWAKEPQLHRALFALETILIHEVGVIDGKHALERKSVAQVVMNRYFDDFYNRLQENQGIKNYLNKDIQTKDFPWLNVLFKTGEFSFTYHYISAVVHTFCPDMSKRGKMIRSGNLKIALKELKNYSQSFKGYRYFSRVSMPGKIDMTSVWNNYERMPEIAGGRVTHQRKLRRSYLADKYDYLYSFKDSKGFEYEVVRMKDKTYSMRWEKEKPVFYAYRSPHLFTYFSKRN